MTPDTRDASGAPAFDAWLDEFFASYYRLRPVNATFIGVHGYDDRLPDLSPDGRAALAGETESLLRSIRRLPREHLTEAQAMDRRLAEGYLNIQEWECASRHFHHGNPCVYTGEAVFGVIGVLLREFAPFEERLEGAIARMDAIPALLRQGIEVVRRAPAAWIERAVRECDGALALFPAGIAMLLADRGVESPRAVAAAERAAGAFAEFRRYLDVDLRGRATAEYACGEEALGLYLRRGHCLAEDALAIAARAEEEMTSCEAELRERAGEFGASRWQDALAQLADRHPTVEAYYGRYGEVWEAAKGAAESHRLVTWPDFPIRYVARPNWARRAAPSLYFLHYRAPAPLDRVPIVEYLVTPIDREMPAAEQRRLLRATNNSVIKTNHVVHHGGLGHHVQNWHAPRAASRIGRIAAADCALRLAMFCAGTMAEGWACYATDLMNEIGFLDPLERYAQRHARLRMAARAVVDVRLHHGVFTLDEAIACYRDRVGMSPDAARDEAVKNSLFPGAALMYMVGTDLIHALRRALAARPGFDLRAFHDRFLSFGSVPVALIREAMAEHRRSGDGPTALD
jgi:uncharacterized protein (DUF885 family)